MTKFIRVDELYAYRGLLSSRMPLLELGSSRSLTQRFGFLNVTGEEPSEITAEGVNETTLKVTPISTDAPSLVVQQKANVISAEDLVPVAVIKTTVQDKKLFINLCNPVIFHSHYSKIEPGLACSAVEKGTDKSGAECLFLTMVDLTSSLRIDVEEDMQCVLTFVRMSTNFQVGTKYTLPKMRKKGKLANVALAQIQSTPQLQNDSMKPVEEIDTQSMSSMPGKGSSVQKLSRATLALPLPSRYTHHFHVSLLQTGSKSSWSIYFDASDSTLKILLPPQEEFMTVTTTCDDYRAFTRDGQLHVFYIGA